ncbi:hypothetical protein DH2020_037751 [Rehmannia glutinosa]|uniref:Phosphatidic acid phosphatase type 2/haloperoxidase domain-containing protein n=1 Tax=Rehmannia glutinosa TaxID=99300 RepID=A0ABR0V263_REHGL
MGGYTVFESWSQRLIGTGRFHAPVHGSQLKLEIRRRLPLKLHFMLLARMRQNTSAGTGDWFSQLYLPLTEIKTHQCEMREAQLGSYTVRSHGARVARTHMNDWLILILLAFIIVVLNVIHPFYRFVGKDMMYDLKYPLKANTVPIWFVRFLFPILVFLLFYLRRRDVYDLHNATLGILYSVLITGVLTDAIKDAVGRPRPDFFWRCFPDGKEAYDQWGNVVCHGDQSVINEGHKSFPSGHTSWWMTHAYLHILEELRANTNNAHASEAAVEIQPNQRTTTEDLESGR